MNSSRSSDPCVIISVTPIVYNCFQTSQEFTFKSKNSTGRGGCLRKPERGATEPKRRGAGKYR